MGKTTSTLIVALLILLVSFFAFGAQQEVPTGQAVIKKTSPLKTPIVGKPLDLGALEPGTKIVKGNVQKALDKFARDPINKLERFRARSQR